MKKKIIIGVLAVCMAVVMYGCGTEKDDSGAAANNSVMSEEYDDESENTAEGEKTDADVIAAEADENGNYVVNGSFEEPDFTGWTINNVDNTTEELDIYAVDTDCYDGVQSLHFYSGSSDVNFTAEQTLIGLEEGTYKLTGYIQGDTAGDEKADNYFYAVIDGETYKADAELNGYVNWYTVELGSLNVTNGEITIGVNITNAAGGWGTIDAISLVKE